ncbi:MAG: hypothetical protein IPO80_09105 [Propionibacteriaceae bacterium]|nr:hypothetical protein [Propionibacteriaceae bacterium]
MSSPLPESMLASALSLGLSVRPKSRGFAYNADRTLAAFLNVGTSIGERNDEPAHSTVGPPRPPSATTKPTCWLPANLTSWLIVAGAALAVIGAAVWFTPVGHRLLVAGLALAAFTVAWGVDALLAVGCPPSAH